MNIQEARKIVSLYQKLIGTKNDKGFSIDHILIVPRDSKKRDAYLKNYIKTLDMELALNPYINDELDVWAVDFTHLDDSRTLFFNKLSE